MISDVKSTVLCCLLGTLAAALQGQTKPKEVDGWDKIKWGMTIAEARAAYDIGAQPKETDTWTLLELNPIKMGGVEMGVQVGARQGTARISEVTLWSFFGLPSSPPLAGPRDFDTLRTMLIQTYGQPAGEEEKRGDNSHLIKTVVWTFPSTSILLKLEQSASLPNLGTIYLDFTANDTKVLGKP
jgi:hypothetical protein